MRENLTHLHCRTPGTHSRLAVVPHHCSGHCLDTLFNGKKKTTGLNSFTRCFCYLKMVLHINKFFQNYTCYLNILIKYVFSNSKSKQTVENCRKKDTSWKCSVSVCSTVRLSQDKKRGDKYHGSLFIYVASNVHLRH